MTVPNATGVDFSSVTTRTADGRTMIGHVIITRALDNVGADALAVWQVSTEGIGTGAWVVPSRAAHSDSLVARMLVEQCLQRAVVAWDPVASIGELVALERVASIPHRRWEASAITLHDVLNEVGESRAALEKRVAEQRLSEKNIVPLDWQVAIPDPLPQSFDEFRKSADLALPSPAVCDALLLARLVRWCVQRWHETLMARGRRRYLQRAFPDWGILPPRWEAKLADAWLGCRPD